MKHLLSLSFTHCAILVRNQETQGFALAPASEMILVVHQDVRAGTDSRAADTEIISVQVAPDQLREMAEKLVQAADELERLVEPLIAPRCPCDDPPDLGTPPPTDD